MASTFLNLAPSLPINDDSASSNIGNNKHEKLISDRASVSREKVVSLCDAIQTTNQDIVVHTNTGCFTAEAREPDRKKRLFLQLQHARRLCHTLEEAAASSEMDAMSLLELHKTDVCELACLTEAFLHNYTLDSYQHYTQQLQDSQRKHQQQLDLAKDILFDSLHQWWIERNPVAAAVAAAAAAASAPPVATAKDNLSDINHFSQNIKASVSPTKKIYKRSKKDVASRKKKRKKATSLKKDIPFDTTSLKNDVASAEVKMATSDLPKDKILHMLGSGYNEEEEKDAAVGDSLQQDSTRNKKGTLPTSPKFSPANKTSDSMSQSISSTPNTSNKNEQETFKESPSFSFSESTEVKQQHQPIKKTTSVSVSKRCHNCKLSVQTYLRCNFFNTNGSKCLKVYCNSCLTTIYKMEDFDSVKQTDDNGWFCPSCTGNCLCASCSKDRERNERRNQVVSTRVKLRQST